VVAEFVTVGRPIGGISINGLEYLQHDNGSEMVFESVQLAKDYLREHGEDPEAEGAFVYTLLSPREVVCDKDDVLHKVRLTLRMEPAWTGEHLVWTYATEGEDWKDALDCIFYRLDGFVEVKPFKVPEPEAQEIADFLEEGE
jgi:hypothetical protein